jgi:hypothetical protein
MTSGFLKSEKTRRRIDGERASRGSSAWRLEGSHFTDARTRKRFQEIALAALVAYGAFPEIAESGEAGS